MKKRGYFDNNFLLNLCLSSSNLPKTVHQQLSHRFLWNYSCTLIFKSYIFFAAQLKGNLGIHFLNFFKKKNKYKNIFAQLSFFFEIKCPLTAYKLVDKSCFINVSARLDPIEGYRGEEGPPPKLLSSRGFRGLGGSRPPLHVMDPNRRKDMLPAEVSPRESLHCMTQHRVARTS